MNNPEMDKSRSTLLSGDRKKITECTKCFLSNDLCAIFLLKKIKFVGVRTPLVGGSPRAHARRGLITPLVAHPSRRRTCPHAFTLLVAGPSRRRACPHAFTLLVARPARLRACPHIRLDQPQYLIGQRGQKNGCPHEVRNDVYSTIQRLAKAVELDRARRWWNLIELLAAEFH